MLFFLVTGRMPRSGQLPVLDLLTGGKSGFSPRRDDSLHWFRSNLARPTGTWVRLAVQKNRPRTSWQVSTVTIEIVIKSSHAPLHFACTTIARSPVCYTRSTISERRPQKTPNVPYLCRPIRRIETLRKSKLHYDFQHDKQKLFLQPTRNLVFGQATCVKHDRASSYQISH